MIVFNSQLFHRQTYCLIHLKVIKQVIKIQFGLFESINNISIITVITNTNIRRDLHQQQKRFDLYFQSILICFNWQNDGSSFLDQVSFFLGNCSSHPIRPQRLQNRKAEIKLNQNHSHFSIDLLSNFSKEYLHEIATMD